MTGGPAFDNYVSGATAPAGSAIVVSAGTYTLTITDANGCAPVNTTGRDRHYRAEPDQRGT
ncbi:MAG: hypothetical protein IPN38_17285 [Flavobacteriales bacterium]|nr:hypothetical protein [Flavobacteriales bacterium]